MRHRNDLPRNFASEEARIKVLNDQARPAADVAKILDEAQVPNILWGAMAGFLVGDWRCYNEVSGPLMFLFLGQSLTF